MQVAEDAHSRRDRGAGSSLELDRRVVVVQQRHVAPVLVGAHRCREAAGKSKKSWDFRGAIVGQQRRDLAAVREHSTDRGLCPVDTLGACQCHKAVFARVWVVEGTDPHSRQLNDTDRRA